MDQKLYSAYSRGRQTGSRRMLVLLQQRTASGRHGRHLESVN